RYEPLLLNARVRRIDIKPTGRSVDEAQRRPDGADPTEHCRALLRAGICGKPALPALLGRGANLAGPSGYWVGHSSGSFAVELVSVREPSHAARLPRIFTAGEQGYGAG